VSFISIPVYNIFARYFSECTFLKSHSLYSYRLKCSLLKIVTVSLLFIVAGCSSTSGPVIIRESSTPAITTKDVGSVDAESRPATAQPVAPNRTKKIIPVVEKLISQSNRELINKQYEQAINFAERGLRIDRKEPRLYLVLSKAYKRDGNRQQSIYFAKQGLRYAEKNNSDYQELSALSK